MTGLGVLEAVAGVGGLGGVAALISALTAVRTSRQAKDSADSTRVATRAIIGELQPNHGSSLRDRIDAVDKRTELLAQEVTLLANAVDQTNDLVRDRLKAHDREFARLRLDHDQTDV